MKLNLASVLKSCLVVLCLAAPMLSRQAAAQAKVPTQSIIIINNSPTSGAQYSIFPVLSTGQSGVDTWMQGYFKTPKAQLGTDLYPRSYVYRIYVEPSGIPPGGKVTVTLPLYTQIAETIDPTQPNQLAEWWQGGSFRIFQSNANSSAPPSSLTWYIKGNNGTQKPLSFAPPPANPAVPTCVASYSATCTLKFFLDTADFHEGDPFQLTEYSVGGVAQQANGTFYFQTDLVDFDISYVNNVFMPVLMEPYPNAHKIWGWVGIDMQLDNFRSILKQFLNDYSGWPQYVATNDSTPVLKIPSPLDLFIRNSTLMSLNDPPQPDLTKLPWDPIQKLVDNYQACTPDCAKTTLVNELLDANYLNYVAGYSTITDWDCDQSGLFPIGNTLFQMLGHFYGWGPYNTYCASTANLLWATPGYTANSNKKYQDVKTAFDALNYEQEFNPYVTLIHGKQYLNAPYAYAFSVDDAFGNVEVPGQAGFYMVVGSPAGMPNPNPQGPVINVGYGYSKTDAIYFTKYGLCSTIPNRSLAETNKVSPQFPIPAANPELCPISFVDNKGTLYYFTVNQPPPFKPIGQQTKSVIDCSGNKPGSPGLAWCNNITGQSNADLNTGGYDNFVQAPAPAQP